MKNESEIKSIKEEVKQLVSKIIEMPEEKLLEDAKFIEDLGVDSMRAIEIVAAIEKKYRIIIPEEEVPKVRSLKDIYNLLKELMKW
jgi:acyl carrier protein